MKLSYDPFWDVRVHEKAEIDALKGAIMQTTLERGVVRRALALQSAQGFQDFLDGVRKLRDAYLAQLATTTASNEFVRVLQGKVQALDDVLGLLKESADTDSRLAEKLAALQNQLSEVLRRRPGERTQEQVV